MMSKSRWKVHPSFWLLLALLVTGSATACARDEGGSDEREALRAEMDRSLDLALIDATREPELRDIADPAGQPPTPRPQPAGTSASAASTATPTPEPPAEPEAPGTPPPAPEPEPQPEEPEESPEPEARPEAEPPVPESAEARGALAALDEAATLEAESHTLPSGTSFQVRLEQRLNTQYSRPGDVFMATLAAPIVDDDGREIVPAGAEVMGEVVSVRAPDGSGNGGSIEIAFTRIFVGDDSYPIEATAITDTQLQTTKSPRSGPGAGARAGQGALTGAILGGILGGNRKGALIGAGAGAVVGAASGGGGGGGTEGILAVGSQIACVFTAPFVVLRQRGQID